MNITQPNVSPNGRYSTSEACTRLGISRSTLHRYCRAGLITPRYRKANYRPYFIGSDITRLWTLNA